MGIKLMIADDEDAVRNGLEKYIKLHTEEFDKIYTAENGQKALDLILRYKPELMLLDVQMPLLNGIEVMKEAKRAGCLPETIIFSGFDEFSYAQEAIRQGAKDYLLKPCRSSDILKRIQTLAGEVEEKKKNKPQSAAVQTLHQGRTSLIARAREYIDENYYQNISQVQVADVIGITPGYLSTLFSKHMDCGFADYLNQVRIHHACAYLQQNFLKTYEIAFKVGFRDEKYFSKVFKKIIGVSPKDYRNGNMGEINTESSNVENNAPF